MKRRVRIALRRPLMLCLSLGLMAACGGDPVPIPVDRTPAEEPRTPGARPLQILSPPLGPLPSAAPDPERVAEVRAILAGGGHRQRCGPYDLWTDVLDPKLLASVCELADRLDAEYEARIGLAPQGPAREAVVLFARIQDYRRWESGRSGRRGYAGQTMASEGLTVLHADRPPGETIATTLHELTHLVNRRALGSPLPRWLSEGLADALGDSATLRGFAPLQGALGVEGPLQRLRGVLRSGGDLPTLAELVSKDVASFDHAESGKAVYDYEQSALFVRFLLTQPELAPRFRSTLQALAQGGRWSPELLWEHLEEPPETLDRSFRSWLLAL